VKRAQVLQTWACVDPLLRICRSAVIETKSQIALLSLTFWLLKQRESTCMMTLLRAPSFIFWFCFLKVNIFVIFSYWKDDLIYDTHHDQTTYLSQLLHSKPKRETLVRTSFYSALDLLLLPGILYQPRLGKGYKCYRIHERNRNKHCQHGRVKLQWIYISSYWSIYVSGNP